VAIQVLRAEVMTDPERKRRFAQEAQAASALNHPNIITVHDIDTARGVDFIAMEFVAGKTLDHLVGRKGLGLGETLKYAVQIADALATAHAAHLIHRDLKPANVMVTQQGLVKLLDFGLAKLTERVEGGEFAETLTVAAGAAPRTEEGTIVGTVAYMSPEQVEGKKLDASSDIFSFGALLYEMLTGQRAFQGDSRISTLTAILKEEPKPASEIIESLPRELEKLITRCLRKDLNRRFQHMDDVKIALEELKQESDSGQLAGAAPGVSAKRRPRKFVWAAALVPVLVIASLAVWRFSRTTEPAQAPLRVVPLTSYPGNESYPSFSPDGKEVVFSWDGEKRDNTDIYRKLIPAEEPLRLTKHPAPDINPAWSPDGGWIAFLRARLGQKYEVLIIPALGGPERRLVEVAAHPEMQGPFLAWTPDNRGLIISDTVSAGGPHGLFLLAVDSGERRRLTTPAPSAVGDAGMTPSPDGRSLAFIRNSGVDVSDLYLLSLAADYTPKGEPRRLTFDNVAAGSPVWNPDGREIIFWSSRGGSPGLWRIAASGSASPKPLAAMGQVGYQLTISHQGDRLAYVRSMSDRDIWRLELPRPGAKPDPPVRFISSSENDQFPQFSPDGKRILFGSARSGNFEIWIADSDGSNLVQLTSFGVLTGAPRWSPDGSQIAFDSRPEGNTDIFVVDASGGKPRRLTTDPAADVTPSWSHDGKWIYFVSSRSGRFEIWKTPAQPEGTGAQAIQVTKNGGFSALESPDGKFLYYAKENGPTSLWKVPVVGGEEVQVLDSLYFWSNFQVVHEGIYYVPRPVSPSEYRIEFYRFADGKTLAITTVDKDSFGITVSPDRRVMLIAPTESRGSDLMLVENFR
jgi:Tol biopolymer transport system component